jgi:NTP pyrophosphatase (non-canonical NTP hydrolase)
MNELAKECLEIAIQLGQVNKDTDFAGWAKAISSEVTELAREPKLWYKGDMPFELADIIITCLSMSAFYGIDIEKCINKKMQINKNRLQ